MSKGAKGAERASEQANERLKLHPRAKLTLQNYQRNHNHLTENSIESKLILHSDTVAAAAGVDASVFTAVFTMFSTNSSRSSSSICVRMRN